MIKKVKEWVAYLEKVLTDLATEYDKTLEDIEYAWEQFWYDGGVPYESLSWDCSVIDDFKEWYELHMEDDGVVDGE